MKEEFRLKGVAQRLATEFVVLNDKTMTKGNTCHAEGMREGINSRKERPNGDRV